MVEGGGEGGPQEAASWVPSPATSASPTVGRGAHPARAPAPAQSLGRVPQPRASPETDGSDPGRVGLRGWGEELGVLKSPQVVLHAKPGLKVQESSPQGFRTPASGARSEQKPGAGRGGKDVR